MNWNKGRQILIDSSEGTFIIWIILTCIGNTRWDWAIAKAWNDLKSLWLSDERSYLKVSDSSVKCRHFTNPMMNPSNAEAAESKPIQLRFCIPRFGIPTDNSMTSKFTSCRDKEAVSDCRKKVYSATQQKPKHEVHTCFPRWLVAFSSANRPIRSAS